MTVIWIAYAIQHVVHELKSMGLAPHIVNMPWDRGHIDGGVNIVGLRTAVMVPNNAPHEAYELLHYINTYANLSGSLVVWRCIGCTGSATGVESLPLSTVFHDYGREI